MAKSYLSDYSPTPASNTDIDGMDSTGATGRVKDGDNYTRSVMSHLAKFYDDLGAVNTVGGTATAITVTAAEGWTAYGSSANQIDTGTILAIKTGSAATGAATLNVNGIGAKAIRGQGDVAIQANDWIAGAILILRYDASFNGAAGAWVLINPADNTTPVGTVLDYAGTALPAGFLWPAGQNVSRTTYAALFAAIGTTYGAGDGSTTFALPDLRGRAIAGKDNMGGTSADRLTSPINGDNLGEAGGAQSHTLSTTEMPSHQHTGTTDAAGSHSHGGTAYSAGDHAHTVEIGTSAGSSATRPAPGGGSSNYPATSTNGGHTHSIGTDTHPGHAHTFTTGAAGSGGAHNNMQPTFILNKIIYAGV